MPVFAIYKCKKIYKYFYMTINIRPKNSLKYVIEIYLYYYHILYIIILNITRLTLKQKF